MAKKKGKKKNASRNLERLLADVLQGAGNPPPARRGPLDRLSGLGAGQQLLIGALIGAGAVYVLGDEKLRGKLLRSGMNLYASLLSGVEEMREQVADIQAEMAAGLDPSA